MTARKLQIRKGDKLLDEIFVVETKGRLETLATSKFGKKISPNSSYEGLRTQFAQAIIMNPPSAEYQGARVELTPEIKKKDEYKESYFA